MDLVPIRKIKTGFTALLFSLAMTYVLQFFNEMTPRSLVVSFIPGKQTTHLSVSYLYLSKVK